MTPETWHAPIGVAISLFLEIVVLGLLLLVSRQRRSPSRHRKVRPSDELPAQFRAVSRFLARHRDLGDPNQGHSTS
jgi:hypothetical protein